MTKTNEAPRRKAPTKLVEPEPTASTDAGADEPAPNPFAPEPPSLGARDRIKSLTNEFRLFCNCTGTEAQIELIGRIQQHIKALRSAFATADLPLWAKFSGALSTLFFATAERPGFPTFSAFRTLADALDLLRVVMVTEDHCNGEDAAPISALIVDHDAAGRRALVQALEGHGLKVTESENPEAAFDCLRHDAFDVIFADTAIPHTDEFAFLAGLRNVPRHIATPLILVTPQPDFDARSSSILSESCDFIAKPIAPSEAAVKAFVFGLKHRMAQVNGSLLPSKTTVFPQPRPMAPVAPAPNGPPAPSLSRQLASRPPPMPQPQQPAPEPAANPDRPKQPGLFKQHFAALEEQFETLNQALHRDRERLAAEQEGRLAAEQRAAELSRACERLEQQTAQSDRRLQELTCAQAAARRDLEQSARDSGQEIARLQSALQKEATARGGAEQAAAELSTALARANKQLGEGRLQARQLRERIASLEAARKLAQAAAAALLERQGRLEEQWTTLCSQLDAMDKTLGPPAK